jgi:hypothetical protein
MAAIKAGASLPLPLRLKLTRTTTARLAAADIKPGMHVVCVEVPADYPLKLAGARGVVAAEGLEQGKYVVVEFDFDDGDTHRLVPSVLTSAQQVATPDLSEEWAGYCCADFTAANRLPLPGGYTEVVGPPWTHDEYLALVSLLNKNPSIEQLAEAELVAQAGRTSLLSRRSSEILDYAVVMRR